MAKQEELTRFYMSNKELKDSAGNVDKSAIKDWNAQVRQMTSALEAATNGLVKVIKTIDANGNALATFDVKRSQAGSLAIDPYSAGLNQTENFRRISFHKSFYGALAQKTATEAVAAVINEIREMGFKKVIAGFFEGNIGSQKVMEKCGLHLNGKSDEEEYRGKILKCYECEMEL